MKRTVHWLPAHPDEGSLSMNRYRAALERAAGGDPEWEVESILPMPAGTVTSAGRMRRAFSRYIAYPWQVRRRGFHGPVHVLDHSSAHLIPHIRGGVPIVVTVHDLIPLYAPGDLSQVQVERFRRTVSHLARADAFICNSQFTLGNLAEQVCIDGKLAVVAPLGVERANAGGGNGKAPELDAGRKWILSVGRTQRRKNLVILPAVMKCLQDLGHVVGLVRVGGRLNEGLREELRGILGEEGLMEFGKVADATLNQLYGAVDALIFPSTYEGFGLPLLEAMEHGCPVVSSHATSLPEAGGDACLYFDPLVPGEAAAQLDLVFRDSGCRRMLVERGVLRASAHTWEKHWQAMRSVYGKVIAGREECVWREDGK